MPLPRETKYSAPVLAGASAAVSDCTPGKAIGVGGRYDGKIRKKDLETDTPYNTYTRAGLPPTPIALPGMQSLTAALVPAKTPALYFVSRGNGTSQFSDNLTDHNRAVNQYQR